MQAIKHVMPLKSLAVLFFGLVLFSCNKTDTASRPQRKNITEVVYASGKLLPINHYRITSKFPGYVKKIFVKPGDTIKAGDLLISIYNDQGDFNTRSAQNLLALAAENANPNGELIIAAKQELASAKSKFEFDSVNFIRYNALLKSNATSTLTYDQAKTQADISKQNYLRAQNTFNNTLKKLNVEYQNAQNQYMALSGNQNEFNIHSVIDGKVYDVATQEGALVNSLQPIIEIGDAAQFETELLVDEVDIAAIKPGQKIAYSIDAFKEKQFSGLIKEIYPRVSGSDKSSLVKATIDAPGPHTFYAGMTVEANIIISQKQNALVIPRSYLKEGNTVFVKGKKEPLVIKTGVQDINFVEVLDGITEEDELTN